MGLGSGISSVNVTDLAGLERGAEKLRELLSSATMADQANKRNCNNYIPLPHLTNVLAA